MPSDAPARPARARRPQAFLHVAEAFDLPSGLRRVVLEGPGYEAYQDSPAADRYAKLLIADPAFGLEPPYDMDLLRAERPEAMPSRRTYTVRGADAARRRLTIDFVVHGDEGVAGPWAQRASGGEVIALTGAGGAYSPEPGAPWHLLAGDRAALPAIGQALERMPWDARGHVVIEAPADIDLGLSLPERMRLHVVEPAGGHEGDHAADGAVAGAGEHAARREPLVDAIRALDWLDGSPQAFVHGERGAMKFARRHLLAERGVDRSMLSLSAYWARGRAEDAFQAEKQQPIGRLDDDAR